VYYAKSAYRAFFSSSSNWFMVNRGAPFA
jgi:hypothetical protein